MRIGRRLEAGRRTESYIYNRVIGVLQTSISEVFQLYCDDGQRSDTYDIKYDKCNPIAMGRCRGTRKTLDRNQDENLHEFCLDVWSHVNEHNYPAIYNIGPLLWGSLWLCSYGSWIYNNLCNQCLSPLKLCVRTSFRVKCT